MLSSITLLKAGKICGRKYREKINNDTISWETVFDRSADYNNVICNVSLVPYKTYLCMSTSTGVQKVTCMICCVRYTLVHTADDFCSLSIYPNE